MRIGSLRVYCCRQPAVGVRQSSVSRPALQMPGAGSASRRLSPAVLPVPEHHAALLISGSAVRQSAVGPSAVCRIRPSALLTGTPRGCARSEGLQARELAAVSP
ncbi:MAG: hypothetical protein IJ680_08990 [Paludibacteraceae bacterium]|nr:hypothetical protein [Paludibacteraceae bacterium]